MTYRRRHLEIVIASAFLASSACSSSSEPSRHDYDDVAVALSSALISENDGELVALEASLSIAVGEVPADLEGGEDSVYLGGDAELSYRHEITCADAAGVGQETCDEDSDSADATATLQGIVSSTRYDTTLEQSSTWMFDDLQSDRVTINGSSSADLESDFVPLYRPTRRQYMLSYESSYDGLVYDRNAEVFDGTVTYAVEAKRLAQNEASIFDATFVMDATLTYKSDGTVELDLEHDFQYSLDPADGTVTAE